MRSRNIAFEESEGRLMGRGLEIPGRKGVEHVQTQPYVHFCKDLNMGPAFDGMVDGRGVP